MAPLSAEEFRRRFLRLILVGWQLPPVVGLGFLVLVVNMFTPEELGRIIRYPPMVLFILAVVMGPYLYLRRFIAPIEAYLRGDCLLYTSDAADDLLQVEVSVGGGGV